MKLYKVKKGDTLKKIAEELGVPAAALKEANRLKGRKKLPAGTELLVPSLTTDLMDLSLETVVSHQPVIDDQRFRLPPEEYVDRVEKKNLIVLHFTASSTAQSVYNSWMARVNGKPYRVATAYVVDRDGQIYEFFPPERWAWHLGMTANNPNSVHDRRAVGIEIVNVGPLKEDKVRKNQLNWWWKDFQTPWCLKDEVNSYTEASYRGYRYFATFPEVQVNAVRDLVHAICERFDIPRTLPPKKKLAEFDPVFFGNFQGIASHQNFRADKSDIGPAWNWDSLGI
jgi:N-acetyl-anhydromuramyl-L-alanine amidase AmpD